MPDRRSINRSMFWRVLRRSVFANRSRLFVILLALSAGAAITAALLNLQVDAKHRLNSEFSIFGPSAVILPRGGASTLSETRFDQLIRGGLLWNARATLSLIGDATSRAHGQGSFRVVITGTRTLEPIDKVGRITAPSSESEPYNDNQRCIAGGRLASRMKLRAGDEIVLGYAGREEQCQIASTFWSRGDAEDDQIMPSLGVAQRLAGAPGRVSAIQLSLSGKVEEQDSYLASLQQRSPDLQIHPLREFTEAQANIYNRISGILTATVAMVLSLTALCVMAAMTNVAMERKNDVGLMKAIGGSVRRVLRLFLAEAALLGLAGGLIGAAIGIVISIGLGKAVFGVAAQPRLIVYPVSVALTVIVAILAAYPLRRLVHIRPASVFRGEE
jgi:putative ABC transport system permease protein